MDTLPSSPPLLVGSLQPVPKSLELTKTQKEHRTFIEMGKIISGLQVPKWNKLLCWVVLSMFLKAPVDHNGPLCLSLALSLGCISDKCWRWLVSHVDSLHVHSSLSPVLYQAPSPERTLDPCCSLFSRLFFYGPVTTCPWVNPAGRTPELLHHLLSVCPLPAQPGIFRPRGTATLCWGHCPGWGLPQLLALHSLGTTPPRLFPENPWHPDSTTD